ncbi:hypothetical protein [Saccharopolyspora sp. 5N708]
MFRHWEDCMRALSLSAQSQYIAGVVLLTIVTIECGVKGTFRQLTW